MTQIKAEAGNGAQAHRDMNMAHCKLAAVAIACIVASAMPTAAKADVRPLSRVMLGNLQATNAIGEGLATDDFAGVEAAARELERNARELRGWDAARLGFEPSDRSQFDAYLELQEKLAGDLMRIARQKDAPALVAGFARMLGGSCLGCHRDFRDRQARLKASALFMTSFVNTWKDINRGLLLNDFTLVATGARSLVATGQVMSWEPVQREVFHLPEEAQRRKFREPLNNMIGAAGRIEDAAVRGDSAAAQKALVELWDTGCLSCHRQFR